MAKINRYNGNLEAFAKNATGTERTVFGDVVQSDSLDDNINADFSRGWGIVPVNGDPTKQDFNALGYTVSQLLAYLHQSGVAEWNASQEYFDGSMTNRLGSLYRCLSAGHVSSTAPELDPANWRMLSGGQSVTGTATFTKSTNNVNMTGIGSIGLEIGDVVTISGTVSNDKEFTVEVITDANNIIFNQSHAGGTTTKSLVNEDVSATVTLLAKWYNAPIGLGQGWVSLSASRSPSATYTNSTGKPILVAISTGTRSVSEFTIDGVRVSRNEDTAIEGANFSLGSFVVPNSSTYVYSSANSASVWSEFR